MNQSVDLTVSLESLSFYLAQGEDTHGLQARRLSHVDARGRARMVDVGNKPVTHREAVARGEITMSAMARRMIRRGEVAKEIRFRPRGWPGSWPRNERQR